MTLSVNIRGRDVFMTTREAEEIEFHRISLGQEWNPGDNIWAMADDPLRKKISESDSIAAAIPMAFCVAKAIELDTVRDKDNGDYRKWRAGLELPGNIDEFSYGFISISERFDCEKIETLFYAAPKAELSKFTASISIQESGLSPVMIPEHLALVEILKRSISGDDISQAAIINIEHRNAGIVVVRDNRFYRGRFIRGNDADKTEFSAEICTYLMSVRIEDDPLPVVVIGDTGDLRLDWSPVIPAFLGVNDLDHAVSWGISEFVAAGGRCELSAAG